jgi:hypothetical protein
VLRQLDKVLTGDDKSLSAAYVKSKAWPTGKNYVSTEELRRAFAQRLGLRMLLDLNQLKQTIRDGCKKSGTWVYQAPGDSGVYGLPSPVPTIEISEDAVLYTPEEAKTIGLAVKGEEKPKCPVCGHPIDQCVCGEEFGKKEKDVAKKPLSCDGAPAQAFQKVLDLAHDQKIDRIRRLSVKVEGTGKEASNDSRLVGLAVPQMGKGTFRVTQTMNCEFGDETFSVTFAGSWDRYKQVKNLTDAFGKQAEKVQVRTELRADFDEGLSLDGEQFQTIRDVFAQLGFGKLSLTAEPLDTETK